MGPEESGLSYLVGRALNKDVGMEIKKRILGVSRVDRNRGADVTVNDDEDLDTLLGLSLEKTVETPFL